MKTKEDSNNTDRQLGAPFTCRYWQGNHEQIMEISSNTGRSAREVARDLMDDALRRCSIDMSNWPNGMRT